MTKKKQNKSRYTEKEIKESIETVGNLMNQCSNDIWEVIERYPLSPAMLYGCLNSILLTIANDIYSTPPENIHVCNDCKETIEKQTKDTPKKAKEVEAAMYG